MPRGDLVSVVSIQRRRGNGQLAGYGTRVLGIPVTFYKLHLLHALENPQLYVHALSNNYQGLAVESDMSQSSDEGTQRRRGRSDSRLEARKTRGDVRDIWGSPGGWGPQHAARPESRFPSFARVDRAGNAECGSRDLCADFALSRQSDVRKRTKWNAEVETALTVRFQSIQGCSSTTSWTSDLLSRARSDVGAGFRRTTGIILMPTWTLDGVCRYYVNLLGPRQVLKPHSHVRKLSSKPDRAKSFPTSTCRASLLLPF